jgi:hypothetical protein
MWHLRWPEGPWLKVDDLELVTLSRVHWFSAHRLHSSMSYATPAEPEQAYHPHHIAEQRRFGTTRSPLNLGRVL